MKRGYSVRTFEDIIKILETEPKWREELRRIVLTTDLLELPRKFEEFLEGRFRRLESSVEDLEILKSDVAGLKSDAELFKQKADRFEQKFDKLEACVETLKQDVDILKYDVDILKHDVAILKQDVAILKQDVNKLKQDVAMLKGNDFERFVRDKAPAFLGKIIRRCKVIDIFELAERLEKAVEEGKITEEEKDDALLIDIVATGILKREPQKKVVVAIEVSIMIDRTDVERAARRGKVLEKAFDEPVFSLAIGKQHTVGAKNLSEKLGVILA